MSLQVLLFSLHLFTVAFATSETGLEFTPAGEQQCPGSNVSCSEGHGDTCPTGLFCKNGYCECGVYPYNIITCQGGVTMVLNGYCVTRDGEDNITSVGLCLHDARYSSHDTYMHFYLQPNANLLEAEMCGPMNRTGTLCGRCLPDHYPLAYSFKINCIRCPNIHWNWARYIMAAYLPLTLFFLIILFFKINTTSSHFFAFVYCSQTLSLPGLAREIFLGTYRKNNTILTAIKAYLSLYGIWNLDFFRPFYSDLCLGIGILPTLALDYAIAVYPLLLMIISYLLIVLYDRNYRVVTIMWRPFRVLTSLFGRNWNIRTTVIDAFATFFFLSNVKFFSVSFDLLVPTRVYRLYGDTYNYTVGLYYTAEIEYFGREHLPYAILAIALLCLFFIIPVAILAIYPFRFFQKFLNRVPIRWHILHTFVDAFHGCYKNGTEPGTHDYRWFAFLFFILRIGYGILFYATHIDVFSSLMVVILLFHTALLSILQPFKSSLNHYNTIHILFLQLLTLFAALQSCSRFASLIEKKMKTPVFVIRALCLLAPLVYALACPVYWVYTHRRFGLDLIHRLRARTTGYSRIAESNLPDRIENSGNYHRENLTNFSASN
jgi:uncharacterized membrane protein (Fun14 family)